MMSEEFILSDKTQRLTYSALMCAILVVSTLWFKFTLPGTDMLVTTQVFFVLLIGQLLPVRYCFLTVGLYILLGLCGLPVFSATVGPAVLATPSFGYLLGFLLAAPCVALALRRLSGVWGRIAASAIGIIVMYVIALGYIACLKSLYLGAPMEAGALLAAYCFAFLPLDAVKGVLAALLAQRLEKPLKLNRAA